MHLDLARLRPGYNATALAASIPAATWWATQLTASTSSGTGAPVGLTIAALIAAGAVDLWLPCWPTRVLLYTPTAALPLSLPAAHAALALITGAHQ